MATSGIAIDKKVVDMFGDNMQKDSRGRARDQHYCVLVFRFSDDNKNVVVDDKCCKTRADFDHFSGNDKYQEIKKFICETAKEDECFYLAVDCREAKDAVADKKAETKPGFFIWAPDTATTKKKMLISSSKDTLKKKLEGCSAKNLNCSDLQDLTEKLDEHFQL